MKLRYLLLIPALLFFSLFTAWPLFEVVKLSLYKTNFITTKFVGLDNYVQAITDPDFLMSILNSLFYAALMIPGQVLGSLIIALGIYEMSKKWIDASRIVFYLPVLSAGIIIAQVWKWVFHIEGPINWLLQKNINWFGQGFTAIPVISFIVIVSSLGGNIIILLASILSIDKNIIESAKVDGANSAQIKIHIVIPMIANTIILISMLSAIASFQIFENILALAPQSFAATMTYAIYQHGFLFSKHGLAAAEAVILLIITIGMSMLKNRLAK